MNMSRMRSGVRGCLRAASEARLENQSTSKDDDDDDDDYWENDDDYEESASKPKYFQRWKNTIVAQIQITI